MAASTPWRAMSGPDGVDEFDSIRRLFAPLTDGRPEALGLMDDAAVIPSRAGFDLVVTADTVVEGVHFLADDPLDLVARKALRVNLSDLAAKGAVPYGYFLSVAWPARCGWDERSLFAEGLAKDQAAYQLSLLGGDTTATPGPLTVGVTALGWVPAGGMVRRGGAKVGDIVLVTGAIGDGWLGLQAIQGGLAELDADQHGVLARRYRLPEPRLSFRDALAGYATAAADLSDGLLADAGHIAEASGCAVVIDLDAAPVSPAGGAWLRLQEDRAAALAALASGGDDYEIVFTADPASVEALEASAHAAGVVVSRIGHIQAGVGVVARYRGAETAIARLGYRHR